TLSCRNGSLQRQSRSAIAGSGSAGSSARRLGPWTQGRGLGPASQVRRRRPVAANVLSFVTIFTIIAPHSSIGERPRHHRGTAHEKAHPARDCHWRRVVGGGADLNSAVTEERGAAVPRQG